MPVQHGAGKTAEHLAVGVIALQSGALQWASSSVGTSSRLHTTSYINSLYLHCVMIPTNIVLPLLGMVSAGSKWAKVWLMQCQ